MHDRTKGEAGTGNVVEAVRHMRTMMAAIRRLQNMPSEELMTFAKENDAPYDLVVYVAAKRKTSCCKLCCRRHCNSCRCRFDDAAWQRRRICWFRYF